VETVLRIALIYLFILVALRVIGKRELAEMSPFELVLIILIPEIASQGMLRDDFSFTNTLVGLGTIFTLVFLISLLKHRFAWVEEMLEGKPSLLVKDGQILNSEADRQHVSAEELSAAVRGAGLESLEQASWIVLESDGRLSVIQRVNPSDRPSAI
jgi:uncharacterized membrane protein YcaP (DUF421 family)